MFTFGTIWMNKLGPTCRPGLRNNICVLGLVYDLTGYYSSSFYLGGLASVMGAAVFIPAVKNAHSEGG